MHRRLFAAVLTASICLTGLAAPALANAPTYESTILFTHDTHDHFLPAPAEEGGTYGGYTRLSTLLKEERQAHPDAITLDGGDFSMGSLFQTIYSTDAPELRALGAMGYDVTTFGNHEFDYRAEGLADMLSAARESGDPLPAIVCANYKPPEADTRSRQAWEDYGVTDYTVIERGGINYGVFGLMGQDADDCAPMSGMEMEPMIDAAKRTVAAMEEDLAARNAPYFIICLSHAGTENGKGEDYELAEKVDGIDMILSGHTHTTLEEPIRVKDTLIVSAGPYTTNLGSLTLRWKPNGEKEILDYRLIPVDDSAAEDPDMVKMAGIFKDKVGENYLKDYGLTYDQVLADNPYSFTPISVFGDEQREEPLGNLIADSYVYAVKEAEGADYVPVDFAVVAAGVIRASFAQGNITTADAFNVSSLGVGADGTPGYPLVSVWIYGRELKDAFEVDASVTPLMPAAQLCGAGMEWSFNPHRLIFNKVTDCAQVLEDGTRRPIEDDRLYRVVTGLYSGQMLGTVNGKSFGLLTITPRDDRGEPVEDLEAFIVHGQNGAEVKEWYALASYLQSMGTVEARYSNPEGRKTVVPSWNPAALLSQPNGLALAVYGGGLLVLLLVVVGTCRLATRRRRRLRGSGRRSGSRGYRRYRG